MKDLEIFRLVNKSQIFCLTQSDKHLFLDQNLKKK